MHVSRGAWPHSSSIAPNFKMDNSVAPAEILEQLHRILSHPLLSKSARLSTFLRHIVEATLAGEGDTLKEFVIGTEVFKLGDSFDPQTDNIVRVNANRLRGKLAEYYHASGPQDPIVIDLPRGRYVPVFSHSGPGLSAAPPAIGAATKRPSVGRQRELERMTGIFRQASDGTGLMITVSGDAGMGKTTVVEDFLASLTEGSASAWVARGACSERLAKTDAYVPILESLDQLKRGPAGEMAARIMRSVAPAWHSQLATELEGAPSRASRDISAERMRREFIHLFEELSAIRPVILFLDDMHWADASTCDLLSYLGSRMRDIRILILAAYRPSDLVGTHPFLPVRFSLEQRGASHEVALQFLTRTDVECYLQQRFPANRFHADLAGVVHERTEGNPLFMVDMLSFLVDRQMLVLRDGSWQLDRDVSEIRSVIPAGTESMIRLQIDHFTPSDHRILQCAAVQGVQFDSAVISRALSMDAETVEDRLQALDRVHRFVRFEEERELDARTPSLLYHFVHVFYQNALFADVTPTRRATLSLAVAEAMVALSGNTRAAAAAEVAWLFQAGRDDASAARYFLRAARHAAAVFAYPETLVLCESGLRCLGALPESAARDSQELEFSLTLGMAQMVTQGYAAPEVEQTHRRSRELCLRLGEKRRLMKVLWGLHTCLLNAGNLTAALELASEMRQLADELRDPSAVIESLHALGTTFAFMGDLGQARQALEEVFTLSPNHRSNSRSTLYVLDLWVTSLSMLARVLARLGSLDEALEKARASVDLAHRLAHPPSLAYAVFWVGWIHHARGEHSAACSQLEAAMHLCRTHGLPQILEWGRVLRGSSLAHLGRPLEGISDIRTSLDNQLAMRSLLERPFCLTLLAEALLDVKASQEAVELCDEALRIADATDGRSYSSETIRVREKALSAGAME